MPVVALQPREQARAQKRRLSCAGRPKDDKKTRSRAAQTTQGVERLNDRRIATKEYAGVLSFKGPQSAIWGTVRIVFWRPGEILRIEPSLLQPMFKAV